MKKTKKIIITKIISLVLIAASVLTLSSCGTVSENTGIVKESGIYGEGQTEVQFNVLALDGTKTEFLLKTDKETLFEALNEQELIDGEDSQYGFYVKTVNGTTLDFDSDGAYWALYINGEYAMTGVEATKIVNGTVYEMRATKG